MQGMGAFSGSDGERCRRKGGPGGSIPPGGRALPPPRRGEGRIYFWKPWYDGGQPVAIPLPVQPKDTP